MLEALLKSKQEELNSLLQDIIESVKLQTLCLDLSDLSTRQCIMVCLYFNKGPHNTPFIISWLFDKGVGTTLNSLRAYTGSMLSKHLDGKWFHKVERGYYELSTRGHSEAKDLVQQTLKKDVK